MISENRRMVTRVDGIVFLRRTVKKKNIISKYVVTKMGNLKKLSSTVVKAKEAEPGAAPLTESAST